MTLCTQCLKPITGQYVYSSEKNDDKKFCSNNCMYEHYGRKCEKCGKLQNSLLEKDGKKFCSSKCQNEYDKEKFQETTSNFWEKYKGLIIGGVVIVVLLIILAVIFSQKKRKR